MRNKTTATKNELIQKIQTHLEELCVKLPHRHVGSKENKAATDYFAKTIAAFGFKTDCPEFNCIDWTHGSVQLQANNETFTTFVGPYSLACQIDAPLVKVSTIDALENVDAFGKILLMRGELVKEQLMPKNFPFYNPDAHQKIVGLLEQKQPAAIIAATGKNPELAGAWYPFPLIEDGDFDIPSVYMTDKEGERLAPFTGTSINLNFKSRRIPSTGCNVIAKKGAGLSDKLVFCAHIDTKKSTPGALDNGTGVAILLAVAELLADYSGNRCLEIVAINGEDYYAASGEIQYIQLNQDTFDTIQLAINMDLAGYKNSHTIYSLFECPETMEKQLHQIFGGRYNLEKGPDWYQSDHSIFIQNGRPAVAITSANFMGLSTDITHTEKDTLDLVDCRKLAEIAHSLKDIALELM